MVPKGHLFAHFVLHLSNSRAFLGYAAGKKEQLSKLQRDILPNFLENRGMYPLCTPVPTPLPEFN